MENKFFVSRSKVRSFLNNKKLVIPLSAYDSLSIHHRYFLQVKSFPREGNLIRDDIFY